MVVTVETEPAFSHETPESLFSLGGYVFPTFGRKYDISPDGQRFLFLKPAGAQTSEDAGPPRLIVVENWFEELKRRVATN